MRYWFPADLRFIVFEQAGLLLYNYASFLRGFQMSVKRRKILKSDFIELWACLPFSAIIASIYLAGSFKRQSKGNWIDFVGNIYIKFTYERCNICHASMRTKSRLNLLLKCRLNTKPKLSKNNTNILKCQTKRKKRKKEFEIVFYPSNQTKYSLVWNANNAIYYSIIPSLKRQLLLLRWQNVLFSVLKLIRKVNIPTEKY